MNVDAALTARSELKPLRSFLPPKPSYPDYLDTITELELWGFPCGSADKISVCNVGGLGFYPWVGKIPWRRERLPTPVFWPGEFHELYGPGGHKMDRTE